jgi:outer membrane protein
MRCTSRELGALACWALIACAVVLSACTTDQASDVDAYRRISDPPGATEAREHATPLQTVSLRDALVLTAARNEQLAQAGEQYVQALAQRQRAAAALRPTVDLFTDLTLRENTGNQSVVQTDLGLNAQYRVLTGLGDLRNVEASDAIVRAREWVILDLREALLLQTALAYYDAILAERLVGVLESSVSAQVERLNDVEARNQVGFARPLDVSQVQAQVSRTRSQLIAARRQVAEARATLTLLTNVELSGAALSDGFEIDASDGAPSLDEMLLIATNTRQDLVAAHSQAEAARRLVDVAISQYYPTIGVNLDYFLVRAPDDALTNISSLIELRLPLLSAGRIQADVREAWSIFRQSVLEYRLRTREARRDVEVARARLEASRAAADEFRTQVVVARDTLLLAEASYQAGLGTNLERVTAQDELLAAELNATSEEFITKTSQLALLRAMGLLSADLIGTPLPARDSKPAVNIDSPFIDLGPGRAAPDSSTSTPTEHAR